MKARGAALVAVAASIGNMLQGWDNATIAGAVLYIKKEFALGTTMEGLVVAMSLIGATIFTSFAGTVSDWIGRRTLLIISSVLYSVSALVMFWSPNVYVLLLARLLDGFGIGLALTLVPAYISEIAPSDTRGTLNTFPQMTGSTGMFLSYCMVFGMSLMESPNWRLMLAVLFIPSIVYVVLTIFYLPESPRWLVSKGRMREAKQVLQELRGKEDVSGEMALLVEGLGVGGETSLEEYLIQPADALGDEYEPVSENGNIKLYGPEEGLSWIAKPITNETGTQSFLSRHGSVETQSVPLMDPVVTLFGSLRNVTLPEGGSMRSMRSTALPELGSMWNAAEERHADDGKNDQWDEESVQRDNTGEGYESDDATGDLDENLHSPLLSRHTSSREVKELLPPVPHGSTLSMRRHSSLMSGHHGSIAESFGSTGIGGGWQLAWRWTGAEGREAKPEEGKFKRIYLHQEGGTQSQRASMMSLPSVSFQGEMEPIQAAALVSQPALFSKELLAEHPVGPAMVHPSETAVKGPKWTDLLEPGVKRALIMGITLQLLEQFAGINGVLYYTPQILEKAGAYVIFADIGISDDSSSVLISGIATLLMLPCILVAMRLMDTAGRRTLLLKTVPILIVSLVVLVIVNCISMEIFPTRVRGVCIALCSLAFWFGDIIVTYSLPTLLSSVGLKGVFGIYAAVCCIAWVFIFLKVPETKGMPLEVITEFFAMSQVETQHVKGQD
ncbi:hypothetical protein SUGI_0922790 [Cryptomeria japonica]|nr:hypothetical protein SUGI_0922790 [Cryptomeria japonica]